VGSNLEKELAIEEQVITKTTIIAKGERSKV
jgi:hypothetical protein